jgi:hypothetical protein
MTRGCRGPWTGACGLGPPVHRGPIQGVRPPFDLGRPCPSDGPSRMWATGGGETAGAGGGAAAAHRRLAGDGGLGATVHYLRRSLDREQEEDITELTRSSLTVVGRCRRRAAKRGGRDHGCPPGRGLRPQLRAPGRRGIVLVVHAERFSRWKR